MILSIQQSWLLIFVAAVSTSIGNILLKQSRLAATDASWLTALTSPWFLAALAFYSANLLLTAKALDRLPVSLAVPVSQGISFLAVVLMASWLFGDRLSLGQLSAASLIVVGVVLLAR